MNNNAKSVEILPKNEVLRRHELCRELCLKLFPDANGLLVFSRLNIYYLTGILGDGFLWLPIKGEPILFIKQAFERAKLESPLQHIILYNTFQDVKHDFEQMGLSFGKKLALDMGAISWERANTLQGAFPEVQFVNADTILAKARSRKSLWELNKISLAGARHYHGLCEVLPPLLKIGMSERDIAHLSWDVFFSLGHGGINRMGNFGEECFLGHIAVGENGNYPSHFNGPLGLMGHHPATPYMGNASSIWQKGQILALDIGFLLEGYHTDKTQLYFAGKAKDIPENLQRAHDACIEIQDRAAQALKVGAIPSEIWADAKQRAEKLGVSEGFMGLGKNKVPFLGHGIGLVVDEYPVIAHRFEEPLQENMTIALEPKVGIVGIGMVGVENTYAVTERGGKSLTGEDFSIICVD